MIKAKMPSVNGLGRDPFARHPSVLPKILRLQVNNIIGLDKYYRSATLLLRQVETPVHFVPWPVFRCVRKGAVHRSIPCMLGWKSVAGVTLAPWHCRRMNTVTWATIISCSPCSCGLPGIRALPFFYFMVKCQSDFASSVAPVPTTMAEVVWWYIH